MKYDITNEQIEKMCYDFKALADETRIRIILYLLDGEKSVNDISRAISSSQSATSHQLRILKDYHILKCRKQGTVIFYKIADKHVENIIKMSIKHLDCE
ncbi:MAG: winged helix-turn-helix transcriptional regulator [Clostridia bacterium]|nr:winged helix-turn-helix transcriptional regulator [Clostridia bacterium]